MAVLNYLALRPPSPTSHPLLVWQDGSPLTRDRFIQEVKSSMTQANLNQSAYSRHSFQIGAATTAALAAHVIKTLGRWKSETFQLYTHTPPESLAAMTVIASPCLLT